MLTRAASASHPVLLQSLAILPPVEWSLGPSNPPASCRASGAQPWLGCGCCTRIAFCHAMPFNTPPSFYHSLSVRPPCKHAPFLELQPAQERHGLSRSHGHAMERGTWAAAPHPHTDHQTRHMPSCCRVPWAAPSEDLAVGAAAGCSRGTASPRLTTLQTSLPSSGTLAIRVKHWRAASAALRPSTGGDGKAAPGADPAQAQGCWRRRCRAPCGADHLTICFLC